MISVVRYANPAVTAFQHRIIQLIHLQETADGQPSIQYGCPNPKQIESACNLQTFCFGKDSLSEPPLLSEGGHCETFRWRCVHIFSWPGTGVWTYGFQRYGYLAFQNQQVSLWLHGTWMTSNCWRGGWDNFLSPWIMHIDIWTRAGARTITILTEQNGGNMQTWMITPRLSRPFRCWRWRLALVPSKDLTTLFRSISPS